MNRILVIGCPGSGKSTFSRALHRATGIPLVHLDMLYWNPDRTTVDKAVFLERLSAALREAAWIIDGNYASTMELRLRACGTVIFLDYPVEVCLAGIRQRRGKPRSDMPWTETEEDGEFIRFVEAFRFQTRPLVTELLDRYSGKEIYIFTSRSEADSFLAGLENRWVKSD